MSIKRLTTLKHLAFVTFTVALLVLPNVSGWAQQGKKTPGKKVVYEKETVIRFEDSLVEGKVIKPDGFFLLRQRPKKWQDLIKVRENFDPELAEMKFEF